MRNFKHFVFEDHSPVAEVSEDEFFAAVSTECSDMVDAYKQQYSMYAFLFRGVTDASRLKSRDFISAGIRADRIPLEMNMTTHSRLHDSFLRLGLVATRKNSIFCTTNIATASDWGPPFIIFVENGWNATVFDNLREQEYAYDRLFDMPKSMSNEEIDTVVKSLGPRNVSSVSDLEKVIDDQHFDILITGKKYYGIAAHRDYAQSKSKMLGRLGIWEPKP